MTDKQAVRECARRMGISVHELIYRIVSARHFSNEDAVVRQNVERCLSPGTHSLPFYIIRYAYWKLEVLNGQKHGG